MMRSIMTSLPAGVLVLIICSALNVPPVDGAPRLKPRDSFVVSRDRLAQQEPAFASFEGDIYAGHVPTPQRGGGDGELYFMMFDATQKTFDDALLIWLNGGPGCSSLAGGLFFEMGPVTVPLRPAGYMGSEKLAPLGPNEHAWTRASAVMYLEQPAGVGFSTGTAPESEDDVASDFYGFLQNFYDIFGDEFRSKRLYIVGESYAGMYVPSMAHKIYLSNNKKNADESRHVNLAGIGIGNGWMDSKVQGKAVIDYALWHGMIDPTTRDALHDQFQVCLQGGTPKPSPPFHKFNTPDECGMMGAVLSAAGADALSDGEWSGGPNTYDVTTWDNYPVLLGRNGTVDNFFNNPEIRKEIHAPINDWKWEQCIPGAGRRRLIEMDRMLMLDNDKPFSVVPYISDLLDGAGIDVLVYNGDRDMSCNSVGSETLLNEMAWSGQASWLDPHITKRGLWLVDGKVAGYARAHKGLEFVTVYNSGHLVPYNVPREALDLINRFLGKQAFADVDLPVYSRASRPQQTLQSVLADEMYALLIGSTSFLLGVIFCLVYIKCFRRRRYSYSEVPSIL